jgi:ubiquinone/menaquinone biosynthesis C-methylase UbiE
MFGMKERKHNIHPVKYAWVLDNFFRNFIQNPRINLKKYIKRGMTVLDVGCGTGFFTIELANLVGESGKVIAIDVQSEMLDILETKLRGKEIANRIKLQKCSDYNFNISEQVDFVLAFYVVHEAGNQKLFLKEIKKVLKPGGKLLIVELIGHVSGEEFRKIVENCNELNFKFQDKTILPLNRAILLTK